MKPLTSVALVLFISTAFSVNLFAQKDTNQYFSFGAFLTLPIEIPAVDNHEINERLSSIGFPEARHPSSVLGIGLQFHIERMITTFSYNKSTRRTKTDTSDLAVEYRSGSLNVGYDVIRHPYFSLYPYAGFKTGGLNYLMKKKLAVATSFDNYFQTLTDQKEITNSRMHFDIGFGFSHQWAYLVNLRFGYLLPMEKSRWQINNNKVELENAPAVRYRNYISITLGLGNMVSERHIIRRDERRRATQSHMQ
jgi:hypothetical protein